MIAVLIRLQSPFGCFLCDCPPRSALRLVDLQAGEVLDLKLPSDSETFSLLRCGEATGYRQGNQCIISLEDRDINGTRQKLCHSCQKLIPEDYPSRYVLLLMDGNEVKEALCLDENRDCLFLNYQISVAIVDNCKQLLIMPAHNRANGNK